MAALISFEEASALVATSACRFGQELVALDEADGRILASPVYADRDYPPFNRAALDGYAIQCQDWEGGIRSFQVLETIYAGQDSQRDLTKSTCYKIMTGAAVPLSANALIRREDAEEAEGMVRLRADQMKPFLNIARQGEDLGKGDEALAAGTYINASVTAMLAALGQEQVPVARLPKVALFTTGDELVRVGQPVQPNQVRNSNQHLLKALLRNWKIKPAAVAHLPDKVEALRTGLKKVLDYDLLITCGGVSAGDADYLPQVWAELSVKLLFRKVAIKPGKPVLVGILPKGGLVFSLPGNPLSCLVAFTLFVEEFLKKVSGLLELPAIYYPLLQPRLKKGRFPEFFLVRRNEGLPGLLPLPHNGSGDIRAGLYAHGLALHPAGQEKLELGQLVRFYPFSSR